MSIPDLVPVYVGRRMVHMISRTVELRMKQILGLVERSGVAFAGVLLMAACVGDKASAPSLHDPSEMLNSVAATPQNVIMAVGDTFSVQLSAATLNGSAVASLDSVKYVLNNIVDTIRVRVSPAGLVTARASSGSSPVLLNIFAFKDGAAALDQIVIQVTDLSFTGASLSIHPTNPSDSTRLAIGNAKTITPVIKNLTTNQSVPGPRLRLSSSGEDARKIGCYNRSISSNTAAFSITSAQLLLNQCAATFGLNQIRAIATGTVWVRAVAMVYGVVLQDSVQYTLTNAFQVYSGVSNNNLQIICGGCYALIAPGGKVTFQNGFRAGLGVTVTFAFENPTAAMAATPPSSVGGQSGNVTTLTAGQSSDRMFLTPGTYKWTETVSGATPPFTNGTYEGQVVVQ